MRRIKIVLGKFLYVVLAKYLPASYSFFGKPAKALRGVCGRLIL